MHEETGTFGKVPDDTTGQADSPDATHVYVSTACLHGLHDRCRLQCKFCPSTCHCDCH